MDRPIFIIGVARSGTSLLAKILDRHSRLSIFYETRFFPLVGEVFGDRVLTEAELRQALSLVSDRLRKNDLTVPEVAEQLKDPGRTTGDLFEAMMRTRMVARGKQRFGEKTPLHYPYVDRLLKQYPAAQLVFIIRDPRSSYSSFKRMPYAEDVRRRDKTLVGKSLQWNRYLRILAAFERSPAAAQAITVSFERLLSDPEQTVSAICEFLGEDFEPAILAVDSANSSFDDLPVDNPGISRQVLERGFRLTPVECAAIELLCGQAMLERGYVPQSVPRAVVGTLAAARYYELQRKLHRAVRFLRRRLAI